MEFNTLDPERASDAFTLHPSSRKNNRDISDVFHSGEIEAHSIEYCTSFSRDWAQYNNRDDNQSQEHMNLKLVLADFLHELGHDLGHEREGPGDGWRQINREMDYWCFEEQYENGVADVAHLTEDHHIIAEAGRCRSGKLVNGGLRVSDAAFLLLPYDWADCELQLDELLDDPHPAEPAQPGTYHYKVEIGVYTEPEADLTDALAKSDE